MIAASVNHLITKLPRLQPILHSGSRHCGKLRARGHLQSSAGPTMQRSAYSSVQGASLNLDGFLNCIAACNEGAEQQRNLIPMYIEDTVIGYLRPGFADQLMQAAPGDFEGIRDVENTGSCDYQSVHLATRLNTVDLRSAALARATSSLRESGVIRGWRDELYPVTQAFHLPPIALVERAATPHLGITSYGVHVNGYVEQDGELSMWVARRSKQKPTWPGLLDHMAAGGQPAGMSCSANVIKECGEEAGVPAELAAKAVPTGCVSYSGMQPDGLKRDVLFCYDLQLPVSFQPVPRDGEVEDFRLLPIGEVARLVSTTQEYKPNCALVITDFLVRHGILTPDQPRYGELVAALRSSSCN